MAIFGVNFNGQPIPTNARVFAERLNRKYRAVGADKSCAWRLQGVCNTRTELDRMLVQADNGHRKFHVVTRGNWIGVYCG